jgi:hypothetical protein
VTVGACSEGGLDIDNIDDGDWTAYSNINLTGVNAFVARVASGGSGGSIQIFIDNTNGTPVGTCEFPGTGGFQSYANAYCPLNGVSGIHAVYLVYTGSGGNLFNVEYFAFFETPAASSSQLVPGNVYALKAVVNGQYVTAPAAGADALIAESNSVSPAQEFTIVDAGGGNIGFQAVINGDYVTADNAGSSPLIANRTAVGSWETFTEVSAGNGNIGLLAMADDKYVDAANNGASPLIANSTVIGAAESFAVEFVSGVPPSSPEGLTATAGNSEAILNWATALGATGYNIEMATVSGGPYAVIATNVNGENYVSTNLSNGTTYYFVVSALNPAGTSTNSAPASVTPGTLDRTGWVASSSTSGGDAPDNALDGNLTTRWSTDAFQVSGQWFQVDMGATNVFDKIVLNAVNSAGDYPRGYQVNVSDDGVTWSSTVAAGNGSSAITTINFAPQAARYIRVTQTGSASGNYWSIDEFYIYETSPLAPTGLTGTTISSNQISLTWAASAGATEYTIERSTIANGPYAIVATNLTSPTYVDINLAAGTTYYYVVSAGNAYGASANSEQAGAETVSTVPPLLNFSINGGQIQFNWPLDHLGWQMEIQTNTLNAGLGTNWVVAPNSNLTNQFSLPINAINGSVFFRLTYP